jgi:hypothetical protein
LEENFRKQSSHNHDRETIAEMAKALLVHEKWAPTPDRAKLSGIVALAPLLNN